MDEHFRAVADEGADGGVAVLGEAVEGEGAVERGGDAGEGLDEGAVEIEDNSFHGVEPKFFTLNFKGWRVRIGFGVWQG